MSTIPIYNDCVTSLRQSLHHLVSAVNVLDAGVSDFPRLRSVLSTVRHYELIPQPTLQAAEASLRDEIGPSVTLLLDRATRQLDRQARRIETLKARAELQAGRLVGAEERAAKGKSNSNSNSSGNGRTVDRKVQQSRSSRIRAGNGRMLDDGARLRARALRQRREALQYSVERLELEVLQKERELRRQLDT